MIVISFQIMDGVSDCLDNSDECPRNSEDIFSSNHHLIGNVIYRVFLWIMAVFAVVGNLVRGFRTLERMIDLMARNW